MSVYSNDELKNLLEAASHRDESAFEKIVFAYEKSVYNMAYQITGNREDAQDVSQTVFIKLWNSPKDFRGDSSFLTYILKITRNAVPDCLRSGSRKKAVPLVFTNRNGEESEADIADDDTLANPVEAYSQKERVEAVRAAIAKLPWESRQIISLRDIEGLSYAEISKVTGLETGTVKSRIHRARKALRELLISGNFL